MNSRSMAVCTTALVAASVLAACPAIQPGGLGLTTASPNPASERLGPLKTRVVKATIIDRYDGSAGWYRIESQIEVTDAAGNKIPGLKKEFFRLYMAPLPENTKGALPVIVPTPYAYGGPIGGIAQATPAPSAMPNYKYRVQVSIADMQRVPSLLGEIYAFTEDDAPGNYIVRATYKTSSSSGLGYLPAPPQNWPVSITAFISDDSEAGKIDNFPPPPGASMGGVLPGTTDNYNKYNTPSPMMTVGPGIEPYGTPQPGPTFGGFPQAAKLTGRFFGSYGMVPAMGYQTVDGTRSTVVSFPDYQGNFYFASPAAGQYQVVFDLDLFLRFGYQPIRSAPDPDRPIPSPSPTPVASPTPVPGMYRMGPGIALGQPPKLLVSEPVTVPAGSLSVPQVELDISGAPAILGFNIVQTGTDRFANLTVGPSYNGGGSSYYGTPQPGPRLEYQVLIHSATGDFLVATGTSSTSPIYWNLRDASGSVVPSGGYQMQLKFWKAGGTYGGPNFYGLGYPQAVTY